MPDNERDPTTGRFLTGGKAGPGRPKGSRNKLGEAFLEKMHADFEEHGEAVIATVRAEKPDQYLKVIASILPKEMNLTVNDPLEDLSDDELIDRLRSLHGAISSFIGDGSDEAGSGAAEASGAQGSGPVH